MRVSKVNKFSNLTYIYLPNILLLLIYEIDLISPYNPFLLFKNLEDLLGKDNQIYFKTLNIIFQNIEDYPSKFKSEILNTISLINHKNTSTFDLLEALKHINESQNKLILKKVKEELINNIEFLNNTLVIQMQKNFNEHYYNDYEYFTNFNNNI